MYSCNIDELKLTSKTKFNAVLCILQYLEMVSKNQRR